MLGPEAKWGAPCSRNNQGTQPLDTVGKAWQGYEQVSKAKVYGIREAEKGLVTPDDPLNLILGEKCGPEHPSISPGHLPFC